MTNTYNYHNKLTLNRSLLQVKMNFNTEISFVDDGKIGLVQNLVERMNLKSLVKMYSNVGRKPVVNPITMLQILIFCYSEGIYSSRAIEKSCKYDLRLKYLLEEDSPPDHSTISRYRKKLEPLIKDIFSKNINVLIEDEHIDLSSIYIDGTKVEAYANKYTFVWKKAVLKNQEKLRIKIIKELGLLDSLDIIEVKKHLLLIFNELIKKAKNIDFVHGKGKRKTHIQRDYELYQSWLERLKSYEKHLEIMGERNSYSKTDHDATFMRMKEDHMKNGQLKPAYNIQFASSGQFIIGAYGSHYPSDMNTLPLFLDELYPRYDKHLKRIVCDSGYESIENYTYLENKKLESYIKPSNYEISKKRTYKTDISKRENMIYDKEGDFYICANGKKLTRQKDYIKTRKSGFKESIKIYKCFECDKCIYQKSCNKYSKSDNPQTKSLRFNAKFIKYREQSYANITSAEGIDERLNRSIQAEGMFSKLKEGLNYNRFRHRGLRAVICDIHLIAMGMNLNQLHRKLLKNQTEVIKYRKAV